jgi:hypothetical protein
VNVPKKDIAVTISAADRLLETTTDPLHRQILENYRRHAILEVCGEWEAIFAPDMTVENPVYYFNIRQMDGVAAEGDEVKGVYKMLADTATSVMVVEDERLMVADWGFTSDSTFHTYQRGHDLIGKGIEVDDPQGYYIEKQHFAMILPYDERGRMIGEHVYENKVLHDVVQIPVEDYVTLEDARARLLPMLRPLPVFAPSAGSLVG